MILLRSSLVLIRNFLGEFCPYPPLGVYLFENNADYLAAPHSRVQTSCCRVDVRLGEFLVRSHQDICGTVFFCYRRRSSQSRGKEPIKDVQTPPNIPSLCTVKYREDDHSLLSV